MRSSKPPPEEEEEEPAQAPTLTPASKFKIEKTERAVLVGKTGSGKSTLERALAQEWPHVIAFDAKGDFNIPGARIVTDPHNLSRLKQKNPDPIIYRPAPAFWDFDTWNAVFLWVYKRQNCTLLVDEVFSVMRNGQAPFWYQAILTRGRSLNIRTLSCTQRPFSVPLGILSESEHYFCFHLKMADDVSRMASLMGEEVYSPIERYGFWYYNDVTGDAPELCQLKLKGK